MPLVQNPDGTSTWVDDAGAPMFGVPQQASGPAALLAMKSDVDAGIQREPGYYNGIALGKMPSMATGPDALAQASPNNLGAPDQQATAFLQAPPVTPPPGGISHAPPPTTSSREAASPWASAPVSGEGGDPVAWSKAAAAADTARENETNAVIAKDNAERAAKGLPPVKLPGDAAAAPAPAKSAPAGVVMASRAGGAATGQGGGGDGFDPMKAYLSQSGNKAVGGGKAGFTPSSRTVQREGTQSNATLGEQIGAAEQLTKAQQAEAMTRSVGSAAASSVYDERAREDAAAQDAVARSAVNMREKTTAGLEDIARRTAELNNMEVDPERKMKSLGVGGEIGRTLAIVAGQIGAMMMKSDKNLALEMINNAVDRDIKAQQFNIEHKRKGLGDEEKLLKLNTERFGSESAALDAQRALGMQASAAKLEALKQATQSQVERDNIDVMQGQLRQKAADLIAGVEAKQAGTVSETAKYSTGQGGGGTKALTFDQALAYAKYKDGKAGAGVPTIIVGGEQVPINRALPEGAMGKLIETSDKVAALEDAAAELKSAQAELGAKGLAPDAIQGEAGARFRKAVQSYTRLESAAQDAGVLQQAERIDAEKILSNPLSNQGAFQEIDNQMRRHRVRLLQRAGHQ